MRPAQRRAAASFLQERFGFSQRRARRLVDAARSSVRSHRRGGEHDAALRERLISRVLATWAHDHAVALHFIDPGQPIQNAHCESFHSRLRDECLNEHWFLSLGDARQIVEAWRQDYNRDRPHSALGYQTPAEFAQRAVTAAAALPTDDGLS